MDTEYLVKISVPEDPDNTRPVEGTLYTKAESVVSGMTRSVLIKFVNQWLTANQLRPPSTML